MEPTIFDKIVEAVVKAAQENGVKETDSKVNDSKEIESQGEVKVDLMKKVDLKKKVEVENNSLLPALTQRPIKLVIICSDHEIIGGSLVQRWIKAIDCNRSMSVNDSNPTTIPTNVSATVPSVSSDVSISANVSDTPRMISLTHESTLTTSASNELKKDTTFLPETCTIKMPVLNECTEFYIINGETKVIPPLIKKDDLCVSNALAFVLDGGRNVMLVDKNRSITRTPTYKTSQITTIEYKSQKFECWEISGSSIDQVYTINAKACLVVCKRDDDKELQKQLNEVKSVCEYIPTVVCIPPKSKQREKHAEKRFGMKEKKRGGNGSVGLLPTNNKKRSLAQQLAKRKGLGVYEISESTDGAAVLKPLNQLGSLLKIW